MRVLLRLVILRRLRTTTAAMSLHGTQRFEVVSAARLTARLRPDVVIRSQVEHEFLFLFRAVDLVAVGTNKLKTELKSARKTNYFELNGTSLFHNKPFHATADVNMRFALQSSNVRFEVLKKHEIGGFKIFNSQNTQGVQV